MWRAIFRQQKGRLGTRIRTWDDRSAMSVKLSSSREQSTPGKSDSRPFSQMILKKNSLFQISSILSQFLLVLSFLVLKNSEVSIFHLERHFVGVSKLHHLQSSGSFKGFSFQRLICFHYCSSELSSLEVVAAIFCDPPSFFQRLGTK